MSRKAFEVLQEPPHGQSLLLLWAWEAQVAVHGQACKRGLGIWGV